MSSFDELATDVNVKRADVERRLAELRGNEKFLYRYWVSHISVHPNVFHRVLEPLPARQWQVVQEATRRRRPRGRSAG